MNENVLSFIKWGAGTVLTLAIIGIVVLVFNSSKDATRESIDKLNSMNAQIAESDLVIYDGMEVSGSEVVSAIRRYEGDYLAIGVINGSGTTTWYGYAASISGSIAAMGSESPNPISLAIDKSSNTSYVNPSGDFLGTVYRDANGAIVALTFRQQ